MSFDFNRVILVGRLAQDPESFDAKNSDMKICKFSIAVNGRNEEDVSFIDVKGFGNLAINILKFVGKGW